MALAAESLHPFGMEPEEIKRLLLKLGRSQADLARALKMDPASVNRMLKGERAIKVREATAIKSYLEGPEQDSVSIDTNLSRPMELANFGSLPKVKDVALLGTVLGGKEGEFLVLDEIIEYVTRLPGIMGKAKVYALYVQGDSMSPWRESGKIIYVDPDRPPAIGDYVVVQLKQAKEGDPRQAFVKRLVGRSGSKIRLLQWNPQKELEISADRVHTLHRVMELEDLMGH